MEPSWAILDYPEGFGERGYVKDISILPPSSSKAGPMMDLRGPKMGPRWPKMATRLSEMAPRWPKIDPRWLKIIAARCFQNFRNIPQILTSIRSERSGARRGSRRGRGLRVLWCITRVVGWSCRVPDMPLPRRGRRMTLTRMSRRFMDK